MVKTKDARMRKYLLFQKMNSQLGLSAPRPACEGRGPPLAASAAIPSPLGFPLISSSMHTGLTPTRKSHRDSCWQFGCQALTSLGWLRNHVKVMGERKNSQLILQVYLNLNIIRWLRRYEMKMKRKNNS